MAHSLRTAPLPLRLLRALGSLLALAVLIVGVPVVLFAAGTLPGHLPSGSGLRDALLAPDDGHLLLEVLTLFAWAGWAWFLLSFLWETAALVLRRPARRRRTLGAPQRLAAFLLGGLLLLPAGTAMASSSPAAAAAAQVPTPTPAPAAETTKAASSSTGPVHVVGETGETVWDLAREFLGDGRRFEEIRALNPHLPETVLVPAGTRVQLPADARLPSPAMPSPADGDHEPQAVPDAAGPHTQEATAARPVSASAASQTYTVKSGDTLWHIAEEKLGDPEAYLQIAAANPDTVTDPNLIYPGEHLTLPTARPSTPAPPAPANPTPPRHSPPPDAPPTTTGPTHKPSAQPEHTATAGPSARPSAPASDAAKPSPQPSSTAQSPRPAPAAPTASSTPAASTAPSAPSAPSAHGSSSHGVELRTAAGAFALLAGAVTGALALRRLLQRRRRKPGETIAIAEETSLAAAQLAQVAEPTLVDDLDLALRTLAHRITGPLPELSAARLSAGALEVRPADSSTPAAAPFIQGEDGWWVLPADAELLDTETAGQITAPYPVLATIGATDHEELVLLNLAQTRVLLLEGSDAHVREVCISLALELGMSPWADRVEIVTLGFGEELPQLLPTSRIAHKRQPQHAVRDLADWLLTAYQHQDEPEQPYLLLCAAALDTDSAWQIAEALDKAAGLPVVLVASAAHTTRHFDDAELLDASSSELQELSDPQLAVRLQRLEESAFQQIVAELRVSGQPPIPAEGAWRHVADEPEAPAASPPSAPAEPAPAPALLTDPGNLPDLGAFPALLTATTDPAALRLVTAPMPPASPGPPADTGLDGERPGASTDPASVHSAAAETAPESVEESDAYDLHAPEISVLGPLQMPGIAFADHGPRLAQFAALLYFKPSRNADTLCVHMDPLTPWSKKTLDSRLGDLRRTLGDDTQGNPYVPRRTSREDLYRLSPHVRCDWTRFQQLAERALVTGPAAVDELERALGLVRGRPFGVSPLPWAEPHQQEMITRIIDVAHTVATWRMAPGPHYDLNAARQAVATGLEVDECAELLYRDWMRIEHAADNRPGLFTAATRVQQVSRTNRCPLDVETEQLIDHLLGPGQRAQGF